MNKNIDNRVNKVLELQNQEIDIGEIAKILEFSTVQALKSFMSRQGFRVSKGLFIKKEDDEVKETSNSITKKEDESNKENIDRKSTVDTVLELQIYNVPLLTISKMVNMRDFEIEEMMLEYGYVRDGDRFIVKPKPIKLKPEKKKTKTKTATKKKEKTQKQLLEEEYKRNPAKRGTYDPINQLFVINVQLVEIIELQLNKVPISEIAKKMKMTKPGLIEFMDEKGYVLEDNKFIQRKFAKKNIVQDEVKEVIEEKEIKPRIYNDRKEMIKFTEESFKDIQNDIQNMYNWYEKIKDHPIFESLKISDMEK